MAVSPCHIQPQWRCRGSRWGRGPEGGASLAALSMKREANFQKRVRVMRPIRARSGQPSDQIAAAGERLA
jgi:hypothetical protein